MQPIPIGKAWVEGAEGEYEEYYEEDAPHTGLLGGISPTDPIEHDADGTALAYELSWRHWWIRSGALNAVVDLGEADDDKNVGDVIHSAGGFHCLQSCQGKG